MDAAIPHTNRAAPGVAFKPKTPHMEGAGRKEPRGGKSSHTEQRVPVLGGLGAPLLAEGMGNNTVREEKERI